MSRFSAGLNPTDDAFWITSEARSMHELIVGPSGYGKSRYLDYRIRQDIKRGYGVCVIDPDGDDEKSLFKSTLRWLAQEGYWHEDYNKRSREVRILDVSSTDFVTSLNPFFVPQELDNLDERPPDPEPWIIAKSLFTVFERVWRQDFSQFPTIQTLLPAMFVLMMERGLSIVDAATILGNDPAAASARHNIITRARDAMAKQELTNFHLKRDREYDADVRGSRFRISEFTNIPRVRQMFSSGGTPLDLQRIMDKREILLVNLAPDDFHSADARVAHIVGTWLIREFYRLSRTRRNRSPFYLYIDEAADYLTDDIADILFKSRKRALSVTMACQNFQQLKDADPHGRIHKAVTETVNIMSVFGGLRTEAEEAVDFLFELDTETPVQITARPMPNGKKVIVNLQPTSVTISENESSTVSTQRAHARTWSRLQATARSAITGSNTAELQSQTLLPSANLSGPDLVSLNVGAVTSASFAESITQTDAYGEAETDIVGEARGQTLGRGLSSTKGNSPTLIDEVETYFSAIHSLENVRYRAAALLRRLPRRHFFLTVDRQAAERLYVPSIEEIELPSRKLQDYMRRIYRFDPAAISVAEAKNRTNKPTEQLSERLRPITDLDDQPRGRRVDIDAHDVATTFEDVDIPKLDLSKSEPPDNVVPLRPLNDDDDA